MTQGYWLGGVVGHVAWLTRKSPWSPGPFLVVSRYTILTYIHNPQHNSCAPWPAGQLGAGRLYYHHEYICIAHDEQRRCPATKSWYLSFGNIFYMKVVLWRSKLGLRFLHSYSNRNSRRCPPLLSLTSPPKPRFCAEDLPQPRWSTFRRGQPSTCY